MSELVDVLDENGNKTGRVATRRECRANSYWHRLAVVFVVNDDGEILLQKRSPNKAAFPGCWDKSVGGGLLAGEMPAQAAVRETGEEIGLAISEKDLIHIGTVRDICHEPEGVINMFFDLFVLRSNRKASEIAFSSEEITDLKFVSIEWLKKHARDGNPENAILWDAMWRKLEYWLGKN
ncbi:MAG: NUDIX domain-containing protein [Rickettsiales bacterium]|nr:NUDIX domain-containing protein [Rickettsiales bacterium]